MSASSGGQAAKWASDLQFGAPQVFVASYAFDTGESHLWVNPTNEADVSLVDTNGSGVPLSAMAFRQDFITGGANNEILVDAVTIGDDFASVLSAVSVPEPSVGGLLAISGIFFVCVRRRTTS